ncbi:MAG TPA: hypothetical protein VHF25_09190 [Nitriliruptorales bacterium]|nr:hypothetical protein [Nitriliruptorales bacterium]
MAVYLEAEGQRWYVEASRDEAATLVRETLERRQTAVFRLDDVHHNGGQLFLSGRSLGVVVVGEEDALE